MTLTGTEVYKRTATYEREASSIRLHAPQWKLLLSFDGARALSEVALAAGLPFSEAVTQSETFIKKDWISEQPISLEEYLKRASASGNFSGGVIPPSVVINEPRPDARAAEPKAEMKPEVKVEAEPEPKAEAKADAKVEVKPEPKVEVKSEARADSAPEAKVENGAVVAPPRESILASKGPMRLAAIVDYIVSLADTIPLGQLLAYRVFLRVPPEILQSEDIVSIHLVDDTSMVRTSALQKAISTAMQDVIKRPLPDSVYAAA